MAIRLDGVDDDKISVESNPTFALQPYVEWDGLQEQIESAYLDDLPVDILEDVESASDSGSSDGDDSGSSASDSGSSVVDLGEELGVAAADDAPDEEPVEPVPPEPVVEFLTTPEAKKMLLRAKSKGKLAAGVAALRGKATRNEPMGYPKSLAHKYLTLDTLTAAASELGATVP